MDSDTARAGCCPARAAFPPRHPSQRRASRITRSSMRPIVGGLARKLCPTTAVIERSRPLIVGRG